MKNKKSMEDLLEEEHALLEQYKASIDEMKKLRKERFKMKGGELVKNPILCALIVLVLAAVLVIVPSFIKYGYTGIFFRDIFIEAHGMLLDILVIGVFILWLNKLGEKRFVIEKYKEEIDDFREWKSEEAKFRIMGIVKRLNRKGITNISLHNCYLKKAWFTLSNLQGANITKADLEGAHVINANLQSANLAFANLGSTSFFNVNLKSANLVGTILAGANLKEVNFMEAKLEKANLMGAHIKSALNLTVEQLSQVKTLFKARLDPNLMNQIKKNYPNLLKEPKDYYKKEDNIDN